MGSSNKGDLAVAVIAAILGLAACLYLIPDSEANDKASEKHTQETSQELTKNLGFARAKIENELQWRYENEHA